MDCNNNRKTWNVAQRARKISKGQAKIFLTRNAADEQRLAKLTQNLDKEKCAKHTELTNAQRLLLKRYGGGKREVEGEHQRLSRERSFTWDSTFITKFSEGCNLRTRADISRAHSLGNVSGNEITSRKHSHVIDVQMNNRLQNVSLSDRQLDKDNHIVRSNDKIEERRPRAVSEILPPITLPPLYKTEDHRSFPKGGTHSVTTYRNARQTVVPELVRQTRKSSFKAESTGRKMVTDNERRMDDSLCDCRYLRKIDKE